MKCALHFATKLNSGHIQKFNFFLVPSYDLLASARKVFPAPTATSVHRQSFLNQSLDPQSKIPGSAPGLVAFDAANCATQNLGQA